MDDRVGGDIRCGLGPDLESVGTITVWDPPRRYAGEGRNWGPGAPPQATEWIVEARSGDTCLVRVVHSLFASDDAWDDQLESPESGWPRFFEILRLYLTRFPGERCAAMHVVTGAAGPVPRAWDALSTTLGLNGVAQGQRWCTSSEVPALAGALELTGDEAHHHVLVRVDDPTPGLVSLVASAMAEQTHIGISLYLYGDDAHAAIARDEPRWRQWTGEHFPPAAP